MEDAVLTLADRCDLCGAQAFIVAFYPSSELMFCGHHGVKFMAKLVEGALDIYDGRAEINEKPSISANAT